MKKTLKRIACLLLAAQAVFPSVLTARVRGEQRAAAARRAEIVETGEPLLLRLEYLSLTREAEGRAAYFGVMQAVHGFDPEDRYYPLRDVGSGACFLGDAVPKKPETGKYISLASCEDALWDRTFRLSEADAQALAAAAAHEGDANDIWFTDAENQVRLSVRLLDGEIVATGLSAGGTLYPFLPDAAEN